MRMLYNKQAYVFISDISCTYIKKSPQKTYALFTVNICYLYNRCMLSIQYMYALLFMMLFISIWQERPVVNCFKFCEANL